tara:strand:- start:1772 stop:2257 length:486 start_codon:yes stop_codon:yes gene_type:complete
MKKKRFTGILTLSLIIFCIFSNGAFAIDTPKVAEGQVVYVPAYSHIYIGNKELPYSLTVTLSIRNVNRKHSINITVVDYYETQGNLVRQYLDKPVTLKPLESLRYVIPEKNKEGGSGANFIVEWQAGTLVNTPVVEAIMVGTRSQQGVSFTSRGRVLSKEY